MRIGFLGYGEAARAFRAGLTGEIIAFDRKLPDPAMASAMEGDGVAVLNDISGLAQADWIISAVTADQSLLAVEPLLPHLRQGQLLIDINSVSPNRKAETAAKVTAKGALYLDMAVMAPVHPRGIATPVLIAGPDAERLLPALTALGFKANIAGHSVGRATAIKMVRSLFVKGLEAITVEALLAAEASGCFEEILASLSGSFAGLGWETFPAYQFERTTTHGARRAAEMRESGATLADLGLNGQLAVEIANVQDEMAKAKAEGAGLHETVKAVLAKRLS